MLSARVGIIIAITGMLTVASALAGPINVSDSVQSELSKRFSGAKISLLSEPHWNAGSAPQEAIRSVVVGQENARGQVQFEAISNSGAAAYGWVEFMATVPARVLVKRVFPGEKLRADQFKALDLNVASGELRDLRGLIMAANSEISGLQARQTLVEGQPLLSSAVEKTPDVRRGDAIRVQLISNGLVLSTRAIASEPGYLDGTIHVLTENTKRDLVGTLVAPGVVEVKL